MSAAVGSTGRVWTVAMFAVMVMAAGAGAAVVETWDSYDVGAGLTAVLEDDGTLTISGSGDMVNFRRNFGPPWHPDEGYNITSVVIDGDVTSIGAWAFRDCYNLTSVTIGGNVETIGAMAFYGTGLTSVTIPNSVTEIGDAAFSYCRSLTTITVLSAIPPPNMGNEVFYNVPATCYYLYQILTAYVRKRFQIFVPSSFFHFNPSHIPKTFKCCNVLGIYMALYS